MLISWSLSLLTEYHVAGNDAVVRTSVAYSTWHFAVMVSCLPMSDGSFCLA